MLPELWLVVSTICFPMNIEITGDCSAIYHIEYSGYKDKYCFQKVEISTYPVTAKDGETVYHVDNRNICKHEWIDIPRESTRLIKETK